MKKGISLIVLVITIIVMIILAAAIIISISNSNVINKANQAVSDSDLANIKSAAALEYSNTKLGLRDGSITLSEGESIGERIEADLKAQGVIKDGQIVFINNYGGVEDTVVGSTSYWTFDTNSQITSSYTGTDTNVIIPNVIENKKVVNAKGTKEGVVVTCLLGDLCEAEKVTIAYGVKEIGDYAFSWCTTLKDVIIPESVTTIGEFAFCGCEGLNQIKIPSSVKTIRAQAFRNCSLLTNFEIPDSITKIEDYMFLECTALKSVKIPNSVTTIGKQIFYSCGSINSVVIPDSVMSIGNGTFGYCNSLTSVTLSNKLTALPSYTFYNCTSLKNITIPNSVTIIDSTAFSGCSNITIRYSGSATDAPWGATNATVVSN